MNWDLLSYSSNDKFIYRLRGAGVFSMVRNLRIFLFFFFFSFKEGSARAIIKTQSFLFVCRPSPIKTVFFSSS